MESSNAKVLEELKLPSNKFKKLEADVAIARIANLLLSSRHIVTVKKVLVKCPVPKKGNP